MKHKSLANQAYSDIRKKILSNQLMPGTRLTEDSWAKQLSVNRIAIREALTRLLGERMVEKGAKGGFFVKSFTVEDFQEIREIREILELGALKLIIQKKRNKDIVSKLEIICNDYRSMIEKGYNSGALEADMKFHETIILEARNQKLWELYTSSNIPLFHQKIGKIQTDADDYEITYNEHESLVKAIEAEDYNLAKDVLTKHFKRGESLVLEL